MVKDINGKEIKVGDIVVHGATRGLRVGVVSNVGVGTIAIKTKDSNRAFVGYDCDERTVVLREWS